MSTQCWSHVDLLEHDESKPNFDWLGHGFHTNWAAMYVQQPDGIDVTYTKLLIGKVDPELLFSLLRYIVYKS